MPKPGSSNLQEVATAGKPPFASKREPGLVFMGLALHAKFLLVGIHLQPAAIQGLMET